jgi:phosphoserine phosphatase
MVIHNGVKILSQKEISIRYYFDSFLRRHYAPGKGPTNEEIERWCERNATSLHRPEFRRLVARLKNHFGDRNEQS